ncbi:diaminopimelate aminotransferase [Thermocladium modestius]|uniref:Diaminopimelate aminotransferase n=1 Tax=Thermocladium modestius TaxID=62609 RepID=A0A830GVF4_9CREN|nr:M20 family metallo-hydrolase [Thermocladium modestius]GGP20489.1 diaminopimelate aminotransferase [Thermocladium modestius]
MDTNELRAETIKIMKEMIPIKALAPENGGEGELDRAEFLQGYIRPFFDEVRRVDAPDPRAKGGVRPNIVATTRGERMLWIIAHMDTVPEGDPNLWRYPPFQATVEGNKIYGRGTEDDGQGVLEGILLAEAAREEELRGLGVILASDEEVGSKYGIQYLLKAEPNLIKPGDLVIVPDAGSPDGSRVEVAEKGILWMRISVEGKQTHASTPGKGLNAARLGMRLAIEMDTYLHERYNAIDAMFEPPISTFEPTKREKNVDNVNTIPGTDVYYFDCRILPVYRIDDVLTDVRKLAESFCSIYGCKINVEVVNREDPSQPTPPDSPVVTGLINALKRTRGVSAVPVGIGGGTYAKYLRERGMPTAVWMTIDETAHSPNEYMVIDNAIKDVETLLVMLRELNSTTSK